MPDRDGEFSDFVAEVSPRLLRTAWFLTGDAHTAEDLVQSALEKVYLRWGRLRGQDPGAYARRCVVNENIDSHRKRRRERVEAAPPERATHDAEPEDRTALTAMLARLPKRERQVVVLRHYVGLSEAETAATIGCSLGTVKSSNSRGLAKLRAQNPDGLAPHDLTTHDLSPHERRPRDPNIHDSSTAGLTVETGQEA